MHLHTECNHKEKSIRDKPLQRLDNIVHRLMRYDTPRHHLSTLKGQESVH